MRLAEELDWKGLNTQSRYTEHVTPITLKSPLSSPPFWRPRFFVLNFCTKVERVFLYRIVSLNSGFRREVDETCSLLSHCTANSGNSLPTFRDNPSVPYFRFSRNVGHYSLRNSPEDCSSNGMICYRSGRLDKSGRHRTRAQYLRIR
jgi:hypothetical protein